MKNSLFVLLLPFLFFLGDDNFLGKQKKYVNVKMAYKHKFSSLSEDLKHLNISMNSMRMILVAFKMEKKIELYVKSAEGEKFLLFKTYEICESSGELGPKRKEGDLQVPEGFYYINHFNPTSSYYLSLGINYPNQSDKIKSGSEKPGGNIYIHGDCVTIGCLPVTDDKIKEIYVLACQAKASGQNHIPVYIFPYEMNKTTHEKMKSLNSKRTGLINFWENLREGYNSFSGCKCELNYIVERDGKYKFR